MARGGGDHTNWRQQWRGLGLPWAGRGGARPFCLVQKDRRLRICFSFFMLLLLLLLLLVVVVLVVFVFVVVWVVDSKSPKMS